MDTNNVSTMNPQAFCSSCGKPIRAEAAFCPFCGQAQKEHNAAPVQNMNKQTEQEQGAQRNSDPVIVNNYGYIPQEMTVGRWMLTMFITGIPVLGFIMLIVWALSSSPDNRSRKNWAIATFVWALVLIVIAAVFGGGIIAFLTQATRSLRF